MGESFNRPLHSGSLPGGLQQLDMGLAYNQPLEPGVLPASLLDFTPSTHFALLEGVLPPHVVRLHLFGFLGRMELGAIPPSVQHIHTSVERVAQVRAIAPLSTRVEYRNG